MRGLLLRPAFADIEGAVAPCPEFYVEQKLCHGAAPGHKSLLLLFFRKEGVFFF
jgi:hypothetical protein